MADKEKKLYYLDELSGYKVDRDDPDVRGWDVRDYNNRTIGKVDNLVVHKEKERVLYLDVEVDQSIIDANHDPYKPSRSEIKEFVNDDGENHLIVPIGLVDIDEDHKFVQTDQVDYQTFAKTKRIRKGSRIDRDYEVVVLESYNREKNRGTYRKEALGSEEQTAEEYARREAMRRGEQRRIEEEGRADAAYENTGYNPQTEGTYEERRRNHGRFPPDDSLYEREEFHSGQGGFRKRDDRPF